MTFNPNGTTSDPTVASDITQRLAIAQIMHQVPMVLRNASAAGPSRLIEECAFNLLHLEHLSHHTCAA